MYHDNSHHSITKIAILAGIGYLFYRNRDCMNSGKMQHIKNKTYDAFTPLAEGARETKHRLAEVTKEIKFDAASAFDHLVQNLADNAKDLTGEAKAKYEEDLNLLRATYESLSKNESYKVEDNKEQNNQEHNS